MKILAVSGSYRKGKTIDKLIDRAIEGALSNGNATADKIILKEKHIEYCRNCMLCRKDDPEKECSQCSISDEMQEIYPVVLEADRYIFATPVNMGAVTAVMKTFLERLCWVFAKPGRWPLRGCPTPRSKVEKRAIILVSSGIIPPYLRRYCDDATPMLTQVCRDSLNAKVLGSLYAGAVEKRGIDYYLDKAYNLGVKLND